MMLNHYCWVSLFFFFFLISLNYFAFLRISPQAKSYYKIFIKSFPASVTDTDIFLMCWSVLRLLLSLLSINH